MSLLKKTLEKIKPIDMSMEQKIQHHLDSLTKPQGSLGMLEEIAKRYCMSKGTVSPKLEKKMIFTFAADHGVVEEGVSAYPKEVTPQMVLNMLNGGAAINVLASHANASVKVVDIGVDYDFDDAPNLIKRKIAKGTRNIRKEPAMDKAQAIRAIEVGIELSEEAAKQGVDILGTGDMGIGNTTPSAALYAALIPEKVENVTGRGTGIDDEVFKRKIEVIKDALEVNKDKLNSPIEALAALGGFEIAGICGLILGGAANKIPVVVDGFISSAGALVAYRINPMIKDYLFFSHKSQEAGHSKFLEWMGVKPILDLGMRLGEGTGTALAMTIIEASVKIYNEMATFDSAGVSKRED